MKNSNFNLDNIKTISNILVGTGVIVGYLSSLTIRIKKDSLIVEPGVCIDCNGNIMLLEKSHIICPLAHLNNYHDKSMIIFFIEMADNEHGFEFHIDYNYNREDYQSAIELGRVEIDKVSNMNIQNAKNPFMVKKNEINLQYVTKIDMCDTVVYSDRETMVQKIEQFRSFLINCKEINNPNIPSVISYCSYMKSEIKMHKMYSWKIHIMFYELVQLLSLSLDEFEKLKNDNFNKYLHKLIDLVNGDEYLSSDKVIDYYDIDLMNRDSYSAKLFDYLEYCLLSFSHDGDKNEEFKSLDNSSEKTVFDYSADDNEFKGEEKSDKSKLIVGRNYNECDIIIDESNVSSKHLEIIFEEQNYFIIDLNSTNFTYLNGKKIKPFEKNLIYLDDEILLAKNNKLDLGNLQILQLQS